MNIRREVALGPVCVCERVSVAVNFQRAEELGGGLVEILIRGGGAVGVGKQLFGSNRVGGGGGGSH